MKSAVLYRQVIRINKKEYLLELKNLLDSIQEADRDAVLTMAGSCLDAAESDEEIIEKLGRPMAAARRVLKNYEPGCYVGMLEEETEAEREFVCESFGTENEGVERQETASGNPEETGKSIAEKIYAEVFAFSEPENTAAEAAEKREEAPESEEGAAGDGYSEESHTPEREEADFEKIYEYAESEEEPGGAVSAEGPGTEEPEEAFEEKYSEETIELARAVEERAGSESREEKLRLKAEQEEKPRYSVFKIIGYSIPAIALGIPVSVVLVLVGLVLLLAGATVTVFGLMLISFVFLNMTAISDILMTAGAGLSVFALGAELFIFAVYFFAKYAVGFINGVFERGAKNCLRDKSKYRAPIVEEETLGVRLTRTLSAVFLVILALGILSFLFSMILGADIKRIAAAVFGKYDLAVILRYLSETFSGLKAFIFR